MITDMVNARSLIAMAAFGLLPVCLNAQTRCLANPDSAAAFIADVQSGFSDADSAVNARVGLPYRPRSVTLVTQESVCAAALQAYNLGSSQALGLAPPVEEAYLIRIDSAAYVVVPMTSEYRAHNIKIYLTNSFDPIYSVADMH